MTTAEGGRLPCRAWRDCSGRTLAADVTVAGWVVDAGRWHGRRVRMPALGRVGEGLPSGLLTVYELSWLPPLP